MAKFYKLMHVWNSTPVLSLIREHGLPRMTPRPALTLAFQSYISRTSVVHQCRVETSVHYSSSDQRCEDYQGSFQIICGAMHEQNFQSPANCQKSSRAQTGTHEWLRLDAKRIEALSPLTSQGHSRFSLRDIGTLFPIWPTGHRHTIPDLAYGTSAASRVGVHWGSCERGHPHLPSVTVYIRSYPRHSIAHQGCKVNQAPRMTPGLPSSDTEGQCTAPTPWQLSTLTHPPTLCQQTQTHLHTHLSTFKSYGPSTDLCLPVQHALSPKRCVSTCFRHLLSCLPQVVAAYWTLPWFHPQLWQKDLDHRQIAPDLHGHEIRVG